MNTVATTVEIRVEGHLDDHWSAWLGELALTREDDGTTTIIIAVADQAQLHGVLAGLRDIGAVLTGIHTTRAPAPGRSVLERPLRAERPDLRPAPSRPGHTADSSRSTCGSAVAPRTSTAAARRS